MSRPYFTDRQKVKVYQSSNGKCLDCNKILKGYWYKGGSIKRAKMTFTIEDANIHHIIPIKDGGKHNIDNWVLLCVGCHIKRHIILTQKDLKNG